MRSQIGLTRFESTTYTSSPCSQQSPDRSFGLEAVVAIDILSLQSMTDHRSLISRRVDEYVNKCKFVYVKKVTFRNDERRG